MEPKFKSIKLGVHKNAETEFIVSKFDENSQFTNNINNIIKDVNVSFYLLSEVKGSLDIEGEGSSRKIINDLISGKRKPTNINEYKAINLYSVLDWIDKAKPQITKDNIMIVYNMLKQNIVMGDEELENNFDFRQSNEYGFVHKFKTPQVDDMKKGMEELISFINSNFLDEYKIEKALLIQIMFIYFHPFYDFNGRTGRLLTYWYLTLMGEEKIKNIIYLSLPINKDKYSKIWDVFRKVKYHDLTSFMNWLGYLVLYSAQKLEKINLWSREKGKKLNETEQVILFYLVEYEHFISVIDLMKKIDLGLSKQAILNAINNLVDIKLICSQFNKNTMFIKPGISIIKDQLLHNDLFGKMMEDPSKQDIV